MKINSELIAKVLYSASELRYFEKELIMEPNQELQDIVIKCQYRLDALLVEMGMDTFVPIQDLITIVKLECNADQLQVIPAELENRDKASHIGAS